MHLWEVEKNVISRDLKGKYVLLYGKPKSGKTTAACSFPDAVLLAFEKGYNAIGEAYPFDINKWSDYKMALRDLADQRSKDRFKTVIIDTVSICWDMCEKFVCQQNGVQKISDIPWGAGYTACKKEFENSLREITRLGYGVVLIAHSASRVEKTADGSDVEIISPDLPKRASEICNGIVDIIGYIGNEWVNGERKRWLYTRETPTLFAGSRFKYMPDKIPFGYDELVNAIADAIEMAEQKDGATVVNTIKTKSETRLDFKEVREKAQSLWKQLVGEGDNAKPEIANEILKKIEMTMGRRMKLSEFTEDQVDLLQLVVVDMEDMMKTQA
jgi:hypothetical protein